MTMNRKIGYAIAAALFSATVLFSGAASAACSKTSFSRIGYAAYSDGEAKALGNAIGGWQMAVRASLGNDYTDWGRAQGKSTKCSLTGKYYTCTVSARPCS